jgi:glycine/D-amino acid oxidase-like deaminating enzyme
LPSIHERSQRTSGSNRIVICGGGAIGAAIAYFCSRRGAQPIVIERHEVGGAASGKSGGFLALDWCRGSALDRLARRSFELHAELAEQLGNPWLYRRLDTFAGHADESDVTASGAKASGPPGIGGGQRAEPADVAVARSHHYRPARRAAHHRGGRAARLHRA